MAFEYHDEILATFAPRASGASPIFGRNHLEDRDSVSSTSASVIDRSVILLRACDEYLTIPVEWKN